MNMELLACLRIRKSGTEYKYDSRFEDDAVSLLMNPLQHTPLTTRRGTQGIDSFFGSNQKVSFVIRDGFFNNESVGHWRIESRPPAQIDRRHLSPGDRPPLHINNLSLDLFRSGSMGLWWANYHASLTQDDQQNHNDASWHSFHEFLSSRFISPFSSS